MQGIRIGLFVFWAFLSSGFVFAQTQQDIDAASREATRLQQLEQQRQQRDFQEFENEAQPEGADLEALVPKVAKPKIDHCRNIVEITISGTTKMSAKEKRKLVKPYLHRCLNSADIEKLMSDITAFYILKGYVTTRVYLPQQDLSWGQLNLLVVEGKVEKLVLDDGDQHSVSLRAAYPFMEGNLLNLRDIEQGLDQINLSQSNNATMDIMPGSAPGFSTVVIHNQPTTSLHGTISADNEGDKSTGTRQVAVSAKLDRLLGLNDFIGFTHRQTHPGSWNYKISRTDSIDYLLPFGYNSFAYSHSASKYVSQVHTPGGLDLKTNGTNLSSSGTLERTLYRDQIRRLKASAKITAKKTSNFLDHQFLEVSSRRLTVVDFDVTYMTRVLNGALSLGGGYAEGLIWFGALRDPKTLADEFPHAQFRKLKYNANYNHPYQILGFDGAWNSTLTGQHALDTLYGSEQILIGGIYTVRGFISNSMSGDNGYYWQNELSMQFPIKLKWKTVLRPYIAIDYGSVRSRFENAETGSLSGRAIGIDIQLGGFDIEVFNSRPIHGPSSMTLENSHTYISVKFST